MEGFTQAVTSRYKLDTDSNLKLDMDGQPIQTMGAAEMAVVAHIGDNGVAEVTIYDANGNQTDNWDRVGGISYESSNPAALTVVDDDANPQDARIEFLAITHQLDPNTGEPIPDSAADVFIDVTFDGRVGPDESPIHLRSEPIMVVAGEAASGEVTIRFEPV